MQIPSPLLQVTLTGTSAGSADWQLGQRLEAVVLSHSASSGATSVRIGQQVLLLQLPTALPEGSRVSLQVMQTGQQPVLRLITAPLPDLPTHTAPNLTGTPNPVPTWLAQLLPIQGSQTPLLAALMTLNRQPTLLAGLPTEVRSAVEQLIRQLPTVNQALHAEGLRQAVQTSGLFHEAMLAHLAQVQTGSNRPPSNLKSALLGLATRLRAYANASTPARETPPPRPGASPSPQGRFAADILGLNATALLGQLNARTRQALARLVLHQWGNLESSESGQTRWLLELPLRDGNNIDLIHLLMEREKAKKRQHEESVWRVQLALDWPELGALHIRIAVAGHKVDVRLWAEHDATAEQVQQALPTLRAALQAHELQVGSLACYLGQPPEPPPAPDIQDGPPPHSGLVNDRA